MIEAHMTGASRLSYVVREVKGTVKRSCCKVGKKGEGIVWGEREEPIGYLVYFPRGHVLRIRDKAMLKHYGLDRKPRIVDLGGLTDPNTPLGQMMLAQGDDARHAAWEQMEDMVIKLATARTGPIIMPEQLKTTA